MRPEFYAQDFTAADPGQLALEIEGAQAGDPHGTTAAYRHLVKTLVKRLGANPNTLAVKTSEKRQVRLPLWFIYMIIPTGVHTIHQRSNSPASLVRGTRILSFYLCI